MSWEDELNQTKTASEQIELLSQDMDRLMLFHEQALATLEQKTEQLNQSNKQAIAEYQRLDERQANALRFVKEQQTALESVNNELNKTLKEREKKTVLVEKWLEIAFYGVISVILYQALTTSLWQTLGFKALYEQVQQFKYGELIVTAVYILLNIIALMWLVKKLVKVWRY